MKNHSLPILSALFILTGGCSQAFSATVSLLEDRGLTTYDKATGLEWLDLSLTLGRNYQSVADGWNGYTTTEGYRFATRSEVLQLFLDAGVPPEAINAGWTHTGNEALTGLFSLLGTGITLSETVFSTMYYDPSSEPALPGPLYVPGAGFSRWTSPDGAQTSFLTPVVQTLRDLNEPDMASALVRTASVPEPSGGFLAVAAIGAVLLPARRRR